MMVGLNNAIASLPEAAFCELEAHIITAAPIVLPPPRPHSRRRRSAARYRRCPTAKQQRFGPTRQVVVKLPSQPRYDVFCESDS